MNKAIFYSLLLLALVGASWLGWQWSQPAPAIAQNGAIKNKIQDDPVPAPSAGGRKPGAGRAVTVNAQAAIARRIEDRIVAVGTLLAAQSVQLAPEVDGRLVKIAVSDGAWVNQDDVLFELDGAVTEAELAQSQAELGLARADLARARNLAKNNFVSERSREEAQANVKVLEAKLQVVRARLSKTRIRAPFDGRVGLLEVDLGAYVKAGTSLVRLDDLSTLKLDLRVPERLLSRLAVGQSIRVGFDAWPGREFEARVETIDTAIDDAGRSVVVRGRLDNAENLLRPGMFARARLVLAAREAAVMVPEESILASAEGEYLFVVRADKAERQPIEAGARYQGEVEILSGVQAGDLVVTAGQGKLRGDQVAVKVIAPVTGTGPMQDADAAANNAAQS